MSVFTIIGGKIVEQTFKKGAKEAAKKTAKKAAPKVAKDDKVTKPKRGRPTKAQRAAKTRALKKQQAAAAAKAAAPKRVRTKRQDLSGLTKEQRAERTKLIRESRMEDAASKGPQKPMAPARVLTLTPEGEKLAKQGKMKELLTKRRRYTYEKTDAPLTSKDMMAAFETVPRGKARKEAIADAFNNMSKQEKIDFIKKAVGPKLTATQINEIVGQGGTKFRVVQQSIRKIMERAKREGFPTTLSGLRKAQKERTKLKPQSKEKVTQYVEKSTAKAKKTVESKINSKAAVAKNRVLTAVKDGKMTKSAGERFIKKIEERRTSNINKAMKNLEAGKAANVDQILKQSPFMGGQTRGMTILTPTRKKKGGKVVPANKKGFSMLPEKVQKKMSPKLAAKYKSGGKIGKPRGCGAAMRGYGKAMK